jgi:hypothetical protein
MVDEEETEFHEEYVNEEDPSILRFLLAAGDEVSSKQLRDDLMTMLIAGHETSAAVLTWTTYLLSQVTTQLPLLLSLCLDLQTRSHRMRNGAVPCDSGSRFRHISPSKWG